MRLLGKVQGLSHGGDLLVQGTVAAPEGTTVVDPTGRELGRVRKILGPVAKPYMLVQPAKGVNARALAGMQVYAGEGKAKGGGRGAKGRA